MCEIKLFRDECTKFGGIKMHKIMSGSLPEMQKVAKTIVKDGGHLWYQVWYHNGHAPCCEGSLFAEYNAINGYDSHFFSLTEEEAKKMVVEANKERRAYRKLYR